MSNIAIDERGWPLVVIAFRGPVTDAEFDGYLSGQSARLRRREKLAVVIDAIQAGETPAKQRKKQAEWQREHHDELEHYMAGMAFAIASPMIRGILTAIFWMQPLPCPHHVSPTFDGAVSWARGQLHRAGVELP